MVKWFLKKTGYRIVTINYKHSHKCFDENISGAVVRVKLITGHKFN